MTVQARRYGRWCREHFDVVAAAQGVPAPRGVDSVEVQPEPESQPEQPVVEQPQG
jgi:hypothetical protein